MIRNDYLKKTTAVIVAFFYTVTVAAQFARPEHKKTDFSSTYHQNKSSFRKVGSGFISKQFIVPNALLTYGFTSLENEGLEFVNETIREEITEHNPTYKNGMDDFLQFAPAAGVYVLNAAGIKGKHNFKDRTIIYCLSVIIMGGSVYAIKQITHQQRPDGSTYNSFPSGHTACAFTSAEFLHQEYGWRSSFYSYAGYATATGTGALRMYNNRHWAADIIAGAGIGILSAKAGYWLFSKIERKRKIKSAAFYP